MNTLIYKNYQTRKNTLPLHTAYAIIPLHVARDQNLLSPDTMIIVQPAPVSGQGLLSLVERRGQYFNEEIHQIDIDPLYAAHGIQSNFNLDGIGTKTDTPPPDDPQSKN